jgi:hypothetical protein
MAATARRSRAPHRQLRAAPVVPLIWPNVRGGSFRVHFTEGRRSRIGMRRSRQLGSWSGRSGVAWASSGAGPGRTTVISVAAKSSPVHSTGCPVCSASA